MKERKQTLLRLVVFACQFWMEEGAWSVGSGCVWYLFLVASSYVKFGKYNTRWFRHSTGMLRYAFVICIRPLLLFLWWCCYVTCVATAKLGNKLFRATFLNAAWHMIPLFCEFSFSFILLQRSACASGYNNQCQAKWNKMHKMNSHETKIEPICWSILLWMNEPPHSSIHPFLRSSALPAYLNIRICFSAMIIKYGTDKFIPV